MARWLIILAGLHCLLAGAPPVMAQENGGIQMPPPPLVIPPPATDNETLMKEDLDRKRERRQKRDHTKSAIKREQEQQEKTLRQEAMAPRLRAAYFDLSILGVQAATYKDRSEYVSNPTSHFNFLWRHNAEHSDNKSGPFFGFRLAPFSGSGKVSGVPGSFGLTYFGPAIGIGQFEHFPLDYGATASDPSKSDGGPQLPVTNGWIVSLGIAAQSRVGTADKEEGKGIKEDIVSKGLDFDTPGLWMEGRILRIHYGATGYATVFGAQTGRGKVFLYLGVAAIALY